jgi:VPDSG-CTERM motif
MKVQFARIASLLCAAACLAALPARAVIPVSVTFDINWTDGDLAGTQSTGTFSYDFSALTGNLHEEVGDGYGLLSLDVTVAGKIFTMADDNDPSFPLHPKVFFVNDVFNGFDYLAFVNPSYELGLFGLGVGVGGASFSMNGVDYSAGDISFRPFTTPQRPKPGETVPDAGATAGLLGVALLALASLRRRAGNGGQLHLAA